MFFIGDKEHQAILPFFHLEYVVLSVQDSINFPGNFIITHDPQ